MQYDEVARAVSERGEVVLRRRRSDDGTEPEAIELRVNGVFVMDTSETSTEQALAGLVLRRIQDPRRVLVGGLGLGFTAREVLSDPRVKELTVVEIEDALVQWMRDGTVPQGPAFLADERLTVLVADIRVAMAEAPPASYDLVLLDVDNGPGFLVYDGNAAVYQPEFLAEVRERLMPGGVLAIWSADESRPLQQELERLFANVAAVPHEVRLQGRHERYWLYLAARP